MNNPNFRRIFLIGLIVFVGYVFVTGYLGQMQRNGSATEVSYTEFLTNLDNGQLKQVTLDKNQLTGKRDDGTVIVTYVPENQNLIDRMADSGTDIVIEPPQEGPTLLGVLIQWFPMLLLIGVWLFFLRQMQGGANRAMGFGRSKAKLVKSSNRPVTFADVAGVEEAKTELKEIVDFLKQPSKFHKLGGRIPKGVLLVGPPGTGKTLIARAVAGEAGVPFFSISGSDFVEMFVGVGASRVRDMFEQGRKNAPCIIFVDEIDAVGRHRGAGLGGGNDEREQTLNQILVELDGFDTTEGIVLVAATNRPDVLDPALLRPGRFDRQVVVPSPDINGREAILNVHLKKVKKAASVVARTIARGTPGFSGADLANLVNEAALLAARKDRKVVTMSELEEAKDKVMMGSERRSLVMSEEERRLTAYHEAGHAIAALHMPASDPIHKATIVPRGRALGMVVRLPERDQLSLRRDQIEANLVVAMGGRVAEEMIFGEQQVTSGASSDIHSTTSLARKMITEWGMSEKLGPIRYLENQEEVFLGHSVARHQSISEATAQLIDAEIKRVIEKAKTTCETILSDNRQQLEWLAQALLEHETLSGEEITQVTKGEPITKQTEPEPRPVSSSFPGINPEPKTV